MSAKSLNTNKGNDLQVTKIHWFQDRKAIMGIGMLIIFIATILVSAVAAGVLVKVTGQLQQKALLVEEAARTRLVSGLEVLNVYAYPNLTAENIENIELITRLGAGADPVSFSSVGLSFVSGETTLSADLNQSISTIANCTFDNLQNQEEYCIFPKVGNTNILLEAGELLAVRYKLNTTHALGSQDDFELSLVASSGASEILDLRVPDVFLRARIRIR